MHQERFNRTLERPGGRPAQLGAGDGWLISVLSLTAAMEVIAVVALMTIGLSSFWSSRVRPLLLGASAIVSVWSLIGTSYRVVGSGLELRPGRFRSRVSLATIASVAFIRAPKDVEPTITDV